MSSQLCPKCQTPNRSGSKFCVKCGQPLPTPTPASAVPAAGAAPGGGSGSSPCPQCGALLRPGARFCPSCGYSIPVPSAPSAVTTPHVIVRVVGVGIRTQALDRPALTVGRNPDSGIVLVHDYVSWDHGRLEQQNGDWHYVDFDSTNGTYINGQRIKQAQLQDGDILRIGDVQGNSVSLTFRTSGAVQKSLSLASTVHLGAANMASKPIVVLGRDPQCDIPLSAPTVSWHHAHITRMPQGHVITDQHSANGTFVNGQRIDTAYTLRQGDTVQVGPFRLIYEASGFQQYEMTGGMRLDGVHLVRDVGPSKSPKRILNDIDISVYPREFIALVGTSGAGKSTLMKALNGFTRADGEVLVNGDNLYRHFDLYRTLIGYVPQDDIIHRELTVGGALNYAAQLRLPPDTTPVERKQRISKVLQQVEMGGHEGTLIGRLSGGQRKRVSIAVELLAEPTLFFLDEPTSGLDPGLEKKMMYTLRQLADGGRTIILVTHATANISQCDHVCFLAQGRMVYYGPPEEARVFFGVASNDFADIYAQLDDGDPKIARQKAAQWEQRFRQSPYYHQYITDRQRTLSQQKQQAAAQNVVQTTAQKGPRVNPVRQFFVLTRRYLDLVFRDRLLLTVLLAVMPIIGLLLVLISGANWLIGDSEVEILNQLASDLAAGGTSATYMIVGKSQTMLFMIALAAVLLGLFAAAYEIVKESSIYQRERMVTLKLMPYLASKVVVLGAFALAQSFLLLLVVSLKVKLPADGVIAPSVLEMYVSVVLGIFAAIMMGLFVSALSPNSNTVIYIVLLVLFFQIIFAGVIFDLGGAAGQLSKLTLTRWTMEGLGSSANIEYLNSLTRTRFVPDPITEEVSMEVEKPAEDWEPVTVVTETQEIEVEVQPGMKQTVPISVPQVTVNDMITVTETVVESVTVDPDPVDIFNAREFQIEYTRDLPHLLKDWLLLSGFGVAFAIGTLIILKRKDVT
ncbi:MAG: FHA domain-containing protein [Anaerolineae bacterium]|nr:FHA domain-containing protein [Anaerolineae bacterium]